jgi:hypothetical protein
MAAGVPDSEILRRKPPFGAATLKVIPSSSEIIWEWSAR